VASPGTPLPHLEEKNTIKLKIQILKKETVQMNIATINIQILNCYTETSQKSEYDCSISNVIDLNKSFCKR